MVRKKNTITPGDKNLVTPPVRYATATKPEFRVISRYAEMLTSEDSYEEGLIGDTEHVWDEEPGAFPDLKSLIDHVAKITGASSDPKEWESHEAGSIAHSFMVDENNDKVTERELEAFAEGKKRLWLADVYVVVEFGTVWIPDEETLDKMTVLSDKQDNPPKATRRNNPTPGPSLISKLKF
jgi:hypothetical protein